MIQLTLSELYNLLTGEESPEELEKEVELKTASNLSYDFRERLIIALASNPNITADIRSTNPNSPIEYWAERNAKILQVQANAIIKEMEK